MIEFTLTRTSMAPIETVFDAIADHREIAADVWACRRSTLDREGTPAPNGVGAIRRLVVIGPSFVEEIIECERPTRYAYKMLSGAPTRNHIGTISLREADTGTEVSWQPRSTLKIPGVDRLMLPVFKKVIDEALACGTPAVASKTSALAELLTGDSGASAGNNPQAIAAAVAGQISLPESARRLSARRRAEQFPWPSSAAGMLSSLGAR